MKRMLFFAVLMGVNTPSAGKLPESPETNNGKKTPEFFRPEVQASRPVVEAPQVITSHIINSHQRPLSLIMSRHEPLSIMSISALRKKISIKREEVSKLIRQEYKNYQKTCEKIRNLTYSLREMKEIKPSFVITEYDLMQIGRYIGTWPEEPDTEEKAIVALKYKLRDIDESAELLKKYERTLEKFKKNPNIENRKDTKCASDKFCKFYNEMVRKPSMRSINLSRDNIRKIILRPWLFDDMYDVIRNSVTRPHKEFLMELVTDYWKNQPWTRNTLFAEVEVRRKQIDQQQEHLNHLNTTNSGINDRGTNYEKSWVWNFKKNLRVLHINNAHSRISDLECDLREKEERIKRRYAEDMR